MDKINIWVKTSIICSYLELEKLFSKLLLLTLQKKSVKSNGWILIFFLNIDEENSEFETAQLILRLKSLGDEKIVKAEKSVSELFSLSKF